MLIILSAGIFLSVIDIFIVNVAIPSIKKGIRGTDADMQLVIAMYLLGYAPFLLAGGRAGDVYGKKNIYVSIGTVTHQNATGNCPACKQEQFCGSNSSCLPLSDVFK